MQFTLQEMKLIERLRKQERRWPRTRWVLLAGGAFTYAAYGYITYALFSRLGSDEFGKGSTDLLLTIYWPKCLLGFLFATWCMAVAFRDWHGNVHRMLLLKLLDVHKQETSNNDHGT